jgi:alkylation response protein AidB-like acyl-CoA dehydrogenase
VNLIESVGNDDPRRLEVRRWLAKYPRPTGRELALAGYVVPHWPAPYGINADPVRQLIIDDELRRADIKRPTNPTGIGWVAPTIFAHGTPEQRDRYLWPALAGEEVWCQLFSEPDAGSDLASLATRAVRDGDDYVINGSKIWTSGAHKAKFGILIARTNPDAPKHKGISYFICPMDLPGIELRDIVDMTTAHSFNQVFFTDVRIPAQLRVGEENEGWGLTRVTLSNERVSLSGDGVLWDSGPSTRDLLDLLRANGGIQDPRLRQQAAQLFTEARILELIRIRRLSSVIAERSPGPEGSIGKLFADEHGARVMEFAKDIVGANGMLTGSGPAGNLPAHRHSAPTEVRFKPDAYPNVEPIWHYGFLFSPALTLGGGTWAIQRNVIGERILGLPAEPDATRNKSWSETRQASPPAT